MRFFAINIVYIYVLGPREQLSTSKETSLQKMKVFLVIVAVALPIFVEPVDASCMSTKGVPCWSKTEVINIKLHYFSNSCNTYCVEIYIDGNAI